MSHPRSEVFPFGCISPDEPEVVLRVKLAGVGDDAIRMGKRLKCAAAALGVGTDIQWIRDPDCAPTAMIEQDILLDQLISTEEVEASLRDWMAAHPAKPR